jgi:hypothetical protein
VRYWKTGSKPVSRAASREILRLTAAMHVRRITREGASYMFMASGLSGAVRRHIFGVTPDGLIDKPAPPPLALPIGITQQTPRATEPPEPMTQGPGLDPGQAAGAAVGDLTTVWLVWVGLLECLGIG